MRRSQSQYRRGSFAVLQAAIANTDLVARAYPPEAPAAEGDYVVGVDVHDRDHQVVLHADITMWLSQPKSGRTRT